MVSLSILTALFYPERRIALGDVGPSHSILTSFSSVLLNVISLMSFSKLPAMIRRCCTSSGFTIAAGVRRTHLGRRRFWSVEEPPVARHRPAVEIRVAPDVREIPAHVRKDTLVREIRRRGACDVRHGRERRGTISPDHLQRRVRALIPDAGQQGCCRHILHEMTD